MTWTPRSPLSFPAHFGRIIIEATTHELRPVLFGSYRNTKDADAVAADFRHYRWCLRNQPGVVPHLSKLESEYQFRISRESEYLATDKWIMLYLTATPDRIEQLIALNPHLRTLVEGAHP